jgi:hypothetical protein
VREKTMAISEREISRKMKVSKITLTEHHAAELKQGKDGWDVVDKVSIRVGTKPPWMHLTHTYGTLIAKGKRHPQQASWHTHTTHKHRNS